MIRISEDSRRAAQHPAWLHVDGAFGLWAAASPRYQALANGLELADSVSVDCHKWLNVPYDSACVFVRDAAAHHAAMTLNAPYYVTAPGAERDNSNWVPEASRRARGFAIYAALRSLGRKGIAELVDRVAGWRNKWLNCWRRDRVSQILNDVVLNQVLVRFTPPRWWRRRCFYRRGDQACSGGWDLLAWRYHLARHASDARRRIELVDD